MSYLGRWVVDGGAVLHMCDRVTYRRPKQGRLTLSLAVLQRHYRYHRNGVIRIQKAEVDEGGGT